jgi:hypothetical protein
MLNADSKDKIRPIETARRTWASQQISQLIPFRPCDSSQEVYLLLLKYALLEVDATAQTRRIDVTPRDGDILRG